MDKHLSIVYIYTLNDPITNEVRYVGKSVNPDRRYKEHIRNCYSNSNHKNNWIKSILDRGDKPIMEIIEETTSEFWSEREQYWISIFDNLTNSTLGGEDGTFTEEVRNKMIINNTGENNPMWGKKWSEEQRKRLSEQRKGVPKSDDFRDKLSKKNGYSCIIDGVEYQSIKRASISLNISERGIKRRIISGDYPNFNFTDK